MTNKNMIMIHPIPIVGKISIIAWIISLRKLFNTTRQLSEIMIPGYDLFLHRLVFCNFHIMFDSRLKMSISMSFLWEIGAIL